MHPTMMQSEQSCRGLPHPFRFTIASTHTGTYGGVQPFETGQSRYRPIFSPMAIARVAAMWHAARQKRTVELRRIEGDATFDGQQRFLEVASRVARERRLSRFAYLARKSEH